MDVRPPIATIESPVAGLLLLRPVPVEHELVRREPAPALGTLDARGRLDREQLGHAHAVCPAKTPVRHAEGHDRSLLHDTRGCRCLLPARATQEGGAQTLGISARYQARGLHVRWQDLGGLELVQLVRRALRAEDLQSFAGAVDLVEREVHQHVVQDLRQTQTQLAAEHEAADATSLQDRFVESATAVRVRFREDGLWR